MASSTTTLTSAPDPSVTGQSVTFTATVQSVPPGAFTPTGTVDFVIDGGAPVTVGLDGGGQATLTTSFATTGTHNATADYSGDANLDPSQGTDTQQVTPASTTTTLTSSPEPSVCGEAVTLTAQVTPVPPGAGTPTGVVTFIISADGPALTAPVNGSGQAQVTVTGLTVGSHLAAASYGGDSNFNGSGSGLTTLTVNQATTATAVTVTPDPSVCGESVTVCATVTIEAPGSGTPTGTVTFTGPGGLNQTVALNGAGQACTTAVTTLTSGTVTATYNGDTCAATSSGTADVTVNEASTSTTVTVTPDPSVCGEAVTVCATVTATPPGSGTPTGTVTFTGPGGLNQTITLDAGQACFTTSTLSSGTITATYNGEDTCFLGSVGTATVTVNEAATTTAVTATPNPSVCGQAVTVCATVAAVPPGS
ncbi:Ig-like domain-containing protein, partial [Wenjunlia tyrosinilytica]|uniref:Ig-like domain-containing protein n=1 Tax=Wenjunlia tyrosinilytica TaxID=1544741 RepID=UPI0016680C11